MAMCVVVVSLWSCDDEKKEVLSGKIDPEHFATMTTTDVTTLISDSGVTRYRIQSPVWYVFDEAKEPRWTFPKGLQLEKFNDLFQVDASVMCDSATYFKHKQLWRLDGYVEIRNMAGELFLTPQLYWDQREQKIYSDSFIHIERDSKVIEGYGFESNEQMTRYHVLRVAGIFPASQFQGGSSVGSANVDTAAAAQPTGLRQPAMRHSQRRAEPPADDESTIVLPAQSASAGNSQHVRPGHINGSRPVSAGNNNATLKR